LVACRDRKPIFLLNRNAPNVQIVKYCMCFSKSVFYIEKVIVARIFRVVSMAIFQFKITGCLRVNYNKNT